MRVRRRTATRTIGGLGDVERTARRRGRSGSTPRRRSSVSRRRLRLVGHGRTEPRLGRDHDGDRTAERLLLGDDPGGQDGQGRHVEEAEPDPEPGQVVRARSRGTGRAPPPRTSRHTAPASRRVGGGSRTARTRRRPGRASARLALRGFHRWPALPPIPAGRHDGADGVRQYEARSDGSDGSVRPPDMVPDGLRPAAPSGPCRPVDADYRRTASGPPGRGLVHDFVHQVIHTNGRSPNARAVRA